jgi:hypothetical protein
MPISGLLQNSAFEPSEVKALTEAFERVCRELRLVQTEDPMRELVARKVIEFAERGMCDPALIRVFVLTEVQGIYQHAQGKLAEPAGSPDADAASL